MRYTCATCGRETGQEVVRLGCACGGLLTLPSPEPFDRSSVDGTEESIWRYAPALPDVPSNCRVRLGERQTPLVPTTIDGHAAWLKAEHLFPTGSYKDRGSAVVISLLKSLGVTAVMDDSSGNAGASLAAYAAAAGMRCVIYAPAGNSTGKLWQVLAYGAQLRSVDGDRQAAADAAAEQATSGIFYASHNSHPAFLAGVATLGFELWEDLGYRAPSAVVVPAGNGSLVLGLWYAFECLRLAGSISRLPRIHAVQASARPALAIGWASGALDVSAIDRGETIAEGIAATRPARGRDLLAAIRASRGSAIAVTEPEIAAALRLAGRSGHYIEPTSAVAVAGYRRLAREGVIETAADSVIVLSGHGLKSAWPQRIGVMDRDGDAAHLSIEALDPTREPLAP